MRWPFRTLQAWKRRRRLEQSRWREEVLRPYQPVIRRLEDRRVMDVSAAFATGTGQLEILLTNTADAATVTVTGGNIVITDSQNQSVAIDIDGGGAGTVSASNVDSLNVRGDAAPAQTVILDGALALPQGLQIDSAIEIAEIRGDITRVDAGDIQSDAAVTRVGADIEVSNNDIAFGGDVVVLADTKLTATNVTFAGRVDDDGVALTGSALEIDGSGTTSFGGDVGGTAALDHIETDAPGRTELGGNVTAAGNSIVFLDPVTLTDNVTLIDTGTSGIQFGSSVDSEVDGHFSLSLSTPNGGISFNGSIGAGGLGDQRLGGLNITDSATGVLFGDTSGVADIHVLGNIDIGVGLNAIGGAGVVLNGGIGAMTIETGGGSLRVNGPLVLVTDVSIATAGGNLTFTANTPIDSEANRSQSLTIDAGAGAVFFTEDIGGTTALRGLTVVRADSGVVFGLSDTELATGTGPVQQIHSVGAVILGAGANVITGGVVFNAGNGNTLQLTTTGDDVRINGPIVLDSGLAIDTGVGPGDIQFDSGEINSQVGEANDLLLNAGRGGIFFSNRVGAAQPLGALTITRADSGVVFGTADVPSLATGLGPVASVQTIGQVDIGVGTNEIGGVGIVLNGGAGGQFSLNSASGDIRLNGPVVLDTNVSIMSGGDLTFTNDAPIDGRTTETNNLTLDAIAGIISINEDIGRTTALGSLTIVHARDGVVFGGATNEFPGTGGSGPVAVIRLQGALDVGVGSNIVGGVGIVLSGSAIALQQISTTDDTVRLNGAVTLATDVSISTGTTGADIVFTSAASIDSAAGRVGGLLLDAGTGQVTFNENIGEFRALGELTVTRADGGVFFGTAAVELPGRSDGGPVDIVQTDQPIDIGVGMNVVAGGIWFNGGANPVLMSTTNDTVRLNGPVRLQSDLTIDTGDGIGDVIFTSAATIDSSDGPGAATTVARHSLTIDAGDGAVFFQANVGATQLINRLTIDRAAAGVVFGGADVPVVGGAGPVTLVRTDGDIDIGDGTTLDDEIGSVILNGGAAPLVMETTGDSIRVNGATTLGSPLSLITSGGDLTFTAAGRIDSQVGETNSLELTLDAGDAEFLASLGVAARLGELVIHSAGNVHFASLVTATRIVQIAGTGTTAFDGDLNTNHATQPGLALTGNSFVFRGGVLTTGDGRVVIVHSGLLDLDPTSALRLAGSFDESGGGSVSLAGDIATSGDTITFQGPVTLTDGAITNVLLSTTAGGSAAGADIRFLQTVNGETAGTEDLLINAGTGGDVLFQSAVGSSVRIGDVTVVLAHDVSFDASLNAQRVAQLDGLGTTRFGGAVDLNHAQLAALDIQTLNVIFLGPVTTAGNGDVLVTVNGLLEIVAAADMTLNGAFRQHGVGTVQTGGDISTTGDDIAFDSAVTLTGDVTLDTGAGTGNVVFARTLNGTLALQQSLRLQTGGGNIQLNGNVGQAVSLEAIRIDNANDVLMSGDVSVGALSQTAGGGETRIDGLVEVLEAGGIVALRNRLITVNGELRAGDNAVVLRADENLAVNGRVSTDDSAITLNAADDVLFGPQGFVVTGSANIFVNADIDGLAGGEVRMNNGSRIESRGGSVTVTASDDVVVGRIIAAREISIASAFGGLVDGGDAGGADLEAPSLTIDMFSGVGRDNLIETSVALLAVLNRSSGGIRMTNDVGGLLTIGQVGVLTGLINGGTGAAGNSQIELINLGSIQVDGAILNRDGGDTIIRAEIPGDLVVNQPIQNSRGDGFISLYAGGDLIIHNSLPEPPPDTENPPNPEQFFEILVVGEGGVRGQAVGEVLIDNADTDYVIVHTDTGQITNVAPLLSMEIIDQGGSDLDEQGRGFIRLTLGDDVHLETNFHIMIDWGDGEIESYPIPGTINPARDPGNEDPRFVSGVAGEPGVYIFSHKYFAPPNPDDPAAPIPVHVELRYDARDSGNVDIDDNLPQTGSAIFNGIVFYRNVADEIFTSDDDIFTNPGTGQTTFIKIVESVIEPVEARQVTTEPPTQVAVSFASSTGVTFEERRTRFELEAAEEYHIFMVVVDDVLGTEGERIPLSETVLRDPVSVFRGKRFPNGHYRIYLEEVRTKRIRLLLDIHIYNGRVVPENFREGSGEKRPEADVGQPAGQPAAKPDGAALSVGAGEPVAWVSRPGTRAIENPGLETQATGSQATAEKPASWEDRVREAFEAGAPSLSNAARSLRRFRRSE